MKTHLSLTGKQWRTGGLVSVTDLVATLQRQRGLDASAELTTPTVFPDMEKAVARIKAAVEAEETIGIFGDYDCDGITASAQLVRYCQRHNSKPYVRLPHREKDGYGLNDLIADELIAAGVDVLITVDTGIVSLGEVAMLQEAGVDVIITDHHQPGDVLPKAFAVLHPELAPEYKEPHPSGAGVAYQLVRALEGDSWDEKAVDQALAMFGTVADLVPLTGDNRLLVQQGLHALTNINEKHPVRELLARANVTASSALSSDIAFRVAPRINAAGRLSDPSIALAALLNGGEALLELDQLNSQRQHHTDVLYDQALSQLGTTDIKKLPPLLSVASEDFTPGIVGLIAGRLTEQFGRPSIVGTIDGDHVTASLRSPKCYHVTEGMRRHGELLERFGGHAQAAGCTMLTENWPAFTRALTGDVEAAATINELVPSISADAELTLREVTLELCTELAKLEPFGQGNSEPVFLLKNIQLDQVRRVGSDQSHLQATLGSVKIIGFRLGHLESYTKEPIDLLCRISLDTWQGVRRPQLQVLDVRQHEPMLVE